MCAIANITSTTVSASPVGDALVITNEQNMCLVCAQSGQTCCQGHEIYVTWGDCRRIARRFPGMDFFEYRGCDLPAYAEQDDDPVWQRYVFRTDGTRRILRRQINGNCVFLTSTGCQLELGARPLICRLYPHLYTARGISGAWDDECKASRQMPSNALEKGIAGVARKEAEQWHQMLYEEIKWEESVDENWIDL